MLFLTARDAVEDRVAGLTAGGDDYVTKPFSLEEVLARLRGLLRRANLARTSSEGALAVADLTMDEDAREVRRGGELIDLTATEFELLRFMMRNPRRVLSKAQILDRVWNYDFGGQAHVVELYISYLRKKIDAGRDPLIHTVRGVGYVLKPALTVAARPRPMSGPPPDTARQAHRRPAWRCSPSPAPPSAWSPTSPCSARCRRARATTCRPRPAWRTQCFNPGSKQPPGRRRRRAANPRQQHDA